MRVTIIPADNLVIVDGEPHTFVFDIAADIHAVQWDGVAGEIEYNDGKPNKKIDTLGSFNAIVNARNADKAAKEQAEAAQQAAEQAAAEQARQDAYNALPAIAKARMEYPPIAEQLEALHEARQGNPAALEAVDAAIAAARAKHGA